MNFSHVTLDKAVLTDKLLKQFCSLLWLNESPSVLLFKPIAFLFTMFVFQGLDLLSRLKAQTETLDARKASQIRV